MLYWSAIVEWLAWSKRHKALRVEVRDTIEAGASKRSRSSASS
jgi:hypothetical protein